MESDDLERRTGRLAIHVMLSLVAAWFWVIPLFVLVAVGQGLGLVEPGVDARPILLPVAAIAGFVTVWLIKRHQSRKAN
jgi:hypothetical protein